MSDLTEQILEQTETEPASAQELAEMIAELEQYRERLVNDTLTTTQRLKVMKSIAMARLEPELAQIDMMLQGLRDRHAALTES